MSYLPCWRRLCIGLGESVAAYNAERTALEGQPEADLWDPDVEARIDLALHRLICETAVELDERAARGEQVGGMRLVTNCPRCLANERAWGEYKAWRRRGLARPAETLAAMGYVVKANVPAMHWELAGWPDYVDRPLARVRVD